MSYTELALSAALLFMILAWLRQVRLNKRISRLLLIKEKRKRIKQKRKYFK